jgi:ATP-dependent Clp protease ATP-binding subunit ClpC
MQQIAPFAAGTPDDGPEKSKVSIEAGGAVSVINSSCFVRADEDGYGKDSIVRAVTDPGGPSGKKYQRPGDSNRNQGGNQSGQGAGAGNIKTPTLDEFGRNLTGMASNGQLGPISGRDKEIKRVIQILGRRGKGNAALIGEPGVGKTAIAEAIAQRIVSGDIPDVLAERRVISLDVGTLLAGTKFRGEFEERLKKIVEEAKASRDILVIDELHTLLGAGAGEGGLDAANILKPALARGEITVIGATTLDEYQKHIEGDPALERRFQPVMVNEPTVEEAVKILLSLKPINEVFFGVHFSPESIVAAVTLSDRYINDRFLPDKAIDLLEETASRIRTQISGEKSSNQEREISRTLRPLMIELERSVRAQDFARASELAEQISELPIPSGTNPLKTRIITKEDIAATVSQMTGVPAESVTSSQRERLINAEQYLHEKVIGQDEAVIAVSRALRRAAAGLNNPNRPIASFIFSGPTGVGKTELTKALATQFFGSEDAMIRLDMSEFMERHTVSKLIGSPPGYIGFDDGGQLTEAVRRKPYTVVLFDEVEKAHPDVFNTLLQLLEDGRLTDSKGRTVDFKNTIIIMTSNIGSKVIEKGGGGLGFQFDEASNEENQYNRIRNLVNEELKQYFRPEFLNRLDETIVFRQLNRDEVKEIADIMLKEVSGRMLEKGVALSVTDAFKEKLVEEGYNPSYGARPLRRAVMRLLEDTLAEASLSGQIAENCSVVVDWDTVNKRVKVEVAKPVAA